MTPSFAPLPLALFGNLAITEMLLIALIAVMVFGRNLPRVAAQAMTQVARARKALQQVWRESGIGEEIRQVQRELEASAQKLREVDPARALGSTVREIEAEVRRPAGSAADKDPEGSNEQVASSEDGSEEPKAERNRTPSWYPQTLQPPSSEDFADHQGLPSGAGISPGGLPSQPVEDEPSEPAAPDEGEADRTPGA